MKRSIIITGSSSGIGAALCRRLADTGNAVLVHARHNQSGCDAVVKEIIAQGGHAKSFLGDLAEAGTATAVVEYAVENFGRLDWVVANAGFPVLKTLQDGGRADMEYAFRGNLFSFFDLVQASRHHLEKSDQPRVVAVGSFTAHMFRSDMRSFPISSSSKAALETLVRSFALELGSSGITVNCVIPGYIQKDQGTSDGVSNKELAEVAKRIPLGRVGLPTEVAGAIEFLLSEDAAYITGQMLHVNGGIVME